LLKWVGKQSAKIAAREAYPAAENDRHVYVAVLIIVEQGGGNNLTMIHDRKCDERRANGHPKASKPLGHLIVTPSLNPH
jgi:hypothetical protein